MNEKTRPRVNPSARWFSLSQRASSILAVLIFAMTASIAEASTPTLTSITPRGMQAGGEHTLKFSGARLKTAEEIFFYDSGITVISIEAIDNNNINVKVKVAEDCRIGEHVAQVRTRHGISDYRSVFVGRLPEVAETEPNNEIAQSQKIDLNVTVTGVVNTEDIDYFKIEGKKGDRLSVEVEAIRLGYLFDPAIALLDKNRFEVAVSDDTPLTKQDSFFSVLLPEDGEYYITIRESSFVGNGRSHYRMHVGNFPRPAAVYPAGGKPGEKLQLQFIDTYREGEPVSAVAKEIELPKEFGFRGGIFYEDESGISPTAMPFRLVDLDNHLEKEPNNTWTQTELLTLPHAVNGVISQPNDYDYFRFTAKKGQVWHVECHARRLGSGLDPVIHIFDAKKKVVVGSDDSRKADSYVKFTAPADGEYYLRVYDHLRRGQPDFIYRIELVPLKPELTLGIKRIDRYSQQRQTIVVPQGGRFGVLMNVKRKDFAGEVHAIGDNLPAGIKMHARPMHANLDLMPVVFEVDEKAPLGGALIDFQGQHWLNEKDSIKGSFENFADFVLGQPNNAVYYGCTVDKLAFAVVEKLPFKLELIQPKVPIVKNGQMSIKIVAHRDEGFDAPINLQFPFRSPGVGTTYQITIPKGKSEALYPINANGNALVGKWPMNVIGNSSFHGPAWTATHLAELEVTDPFVTTTIDRMSIERGQSTQLICKFDQLKPFEGEATAAIVGVPANIVIDTPKKFTKDTKELVFTVQTNEKSPIGKHGGLFCQVTITQNGEPIVSRAGNALLQINKPKPPKPAAPIAAAKPAAKTPVAKPAAPKPAPKPVAKPAAKPVAKPAAAANTK